MISASSSKGKWMQKPPDQSYRNWWTTQRGHTVYIYIYAPDNTYFNGNVNNNIMYEYKK